MTAEKNVISLVTKFVDGLKKASGGCGHMIHHHQKIEYAPIRNLLEKVAQRALDLAKSQSKIDVKRINPTVSA